MRQLDLFTSILSALLVLAAPAFAQDALAHARAAFKSGRYAEAEAAYMEALRTSRSEEAIAGVGECRVALHRPTDAIAPLRQALSMQPNDIAAQHALGQALVELNDFVHGEAALKGMTERNPSDAEAWFYLGRLNYQNGYFGAGLTDFDEALRLAPAAAWKTKALIYRAVCLEKTGHSAQAETAMRALSSVSDAKNDADLELTFAELLYQTGRLDEALKRIDQVLAADPRQPVGYFWRAKVLLQLHRTDEAAKAAEESVRLLPQLPFGHNLLIRIYQLQGRTKEAEQQAEWMREFQRRMDAR